MNQTDFSTPRARLNRRKIKGENYETLCIQVLETTKKRLKELAKERKVGVGRLLDELSNA